MGRHGLRSCNGVASLVETLRSAEDVSPLQLHWYHFFSFKFFIYIFKLNTLNIFDNSSLSFSLSLSLYSTLALSRSGVALLNLLKDSEKKNLETLQVCVCVCVSESVYVCE